MIRTATDSDIKDVLNVEQKAFGSEEEAQLVKNLLGDPSAKPLVSLLAFKKKKPVGHILFTRARLEIENPLSISILAPLAVIPEYQKQGIGGELIRHGIQMLSKSRVDLIFVLGHPEYYPRHGFKPAGKQGFDAPYPIPEKNAGAWMVQALRQDVIGIYGGKIICADAMNRPGYWRE